MKNTVTELSTAQVYKLFDAMYDYNVVINQRNYRGLVVVFCFRRALIIHKEGLTRNIHPNTLRKIWVVEDKGLWGFHV